jgi:hypothetical protein
LNTLGLRASLGDPAGGRPLLQRSVELATQAGDDWCRVDASSCLAIGWIFQDGFDTARPLLDDLQATATQLEYRWGLAWPWLCLGWEAAFQGRLTAARELLSRCVAVSDEVGLPITNGLANGFLTYAHLAGGNTELAYSLASTTLKRVQEAGAGLVSGMANHMLAATLMARGELAATRDYLEIAVTAIAGRDSATCFRGISRCSAVWSGSRESSMRPRAVARRRGR